MMEFPWVSREMLRLRNAHMRELDDLREAHRKEVGDTLARCDRQMAEERARFHEDIGRATRRLELAGDVALAMAKQAQASLQTSRDALKDAVDMARAAAQAMHGPAIPDELPEPDSIAEADRRVARDRRNEDQRAREA